MGGIISGFLGGLSQGMADAGRMMLADKLAKEREEASFLRESALRQDMQSESFSHAETLQKSGFTHAETLAKQNQDFTLDTQKAGQTFTAGENKANREAEDKRAQLRAKTQLEVAKIGEAGANARAGVTKPTASIQELEYLMSPEGGSYSREMAIAMTFPGAQIQHTDEEGNISVAIIGEDGKPKSIGSFMVNDAGRTEWVAPGAKPTQSKPTSKEKRDIAAELNQDRNIFTKLNPNDPEVTKVWEQRYNAATAKPEAKSKDKAGGGVVAGAMGKPKGAAPEDVAGIEKIIKEQNLAPGEQFEYTLKDGTRKMVVVQ